MVYVPSGTPVNVKAMLPVPPQVVALVAVADNVGAFGAVIVTFTPLGDVHPFAVMVRFEYVPVGTPLTVAVPPVTTTFVNVPLECVMVYVPSGTPVNVKAMLPVPPQVVALVAVADNVGAFGAVIVTFTPLGDVHPFAVMVRFEYVPVGTPLTVAVPPVTTTFVNVPLECVMVYVPSGTPVNVKAMLPVPPHVVALVAVADNVGAFGAVIVTFTPFGDVHPFAVMVRFEYVPVGTPFTVAVPPVTTTFVNVPLLCVMVYVPSGTPVNVKAMLPVPPHVVALVAVADSVGAAFTTISIVFTVPHWPAFGVNV